VLMQLLCIKRRFEGSLGGEFQAESFRRLCMRAWINA
jgi:hypothetical protein